MNKATIIEDAISYIEELQNNVEVLQGLLYEMEASSEEGALPRSEEIYPAEEMRKSGIQVNQPLANQFYWSLRRIKFF